MVRKMVITCSRNGLLAAWRQPGLAILLWAWSALLALPLTLPAWSWWHTATARTPEADILLQRFSFAAVGDLLRANSPLDLLVPAVLATAVVALVGQALIAGGLIEVLASDDARPFLHRFFRGAGHFFWRFLRALSVAAVLLLILAGLLTAAFAPLGRALAEIDWEPAWYLGQAVFLCVLALLALVVFLALDYARIRMAREDSQRAIRALFGGLRFVATHLKATIGVWLIVAVLTAAVFAVYLAFCEIAPAVTWATILLALAVQQVTILVRAGLRVALVAGEIAIWTRLAPAPQPLRIENGAAL